MSEDHNRWIITAHHFVEHTSLDAATAELARRRKRNPKRLFRMYRIERVIDPDPVPIHLVGDGP